MEPQSTPTTTPDLAVGYVFSRAWAAYKDNFLVTVAVFVAANVLINAPAIMRSSSELRVPAQIVIGAFVSPAIFVGLYHVALHIVRGRDVEFFMMFDGFGAWSRSIAVFWLLFLITLAGCVLLIVPGIIWRLGLSPALFLVLDRDDSVFDTLGRAWRMTYGYKKKLLWIVAAVVGFNVIGLMMLGVGLIFTGAMSYLVIAVAYDELASGYEDEDTIVSAPQPVAVF